MPLDEESPRTPTPASIQARADELGSPTPRPARHPSGTSGSGIPLILFRRKPRKPVLSKLQVVPERTAPLSAVPEPLGRPEMDLETLLSIPKPSLLDCLLAERPKVAGPYNAKALQGTKATTTTELETIEPLRTIVTCPDTFDAFVRDAQEKLNEFVIDWESQEDCMFAAHVIPGLANSLLAGRIFSEADVVINRCGVGFRPAVAILRLLKAKETQQSENTPKKAKAAGPRQTPKRHGVGFVKREHLRFPYFSSAPSLQIIPDLQLVVGDGQTAEDPEVALTVEFKTSNVWDKANLDVLLTPDLKVPHAVHFQWPQIVNISALSKQCRVIVQVWCQMKRHNFAILSSEQKMCLLIKDRDVLYVSREYDAGEHNALRIIAGSMAAMDMAGNMPVMPDAEKLREQWPGGKRIAEAASAPGIYEPTLHATQRDIMQRKATRKRKPAEV